MLAYNRQQSAVKPRLHWDYGTIDSLINTVSVHTNLKMDTPITQFCHNYNPLSTLWWHQVSSYQPHGMEGLLLTLTQLDLPRQRLIPSHQFTAIALLWETPALEYFTSVFPVLGLPGTYQRPRTFVLIQDNTLPILGIRDLHVNRFLIDHSSSS